MPRLADYWGARARTSFWFTRELSYRLGAVLAWFLGRLGATPNQVSVLSLATAVIGLGGALWFLPAGLAQAAAIFIVLNLAYALDCADGLIARTHGSGSQLGAFLDKFIDVLMLAVIAGFMGAAAGDGAGQWRWIHLPPSLGVAFALGSRLGLCVLIWLREFEGSLPERDAPDERQRNFGFYLRRGAGLISDQVFYITVVSVAWATGTFWDALWIYHGLISVLGIGYLVGMSREAK